MLSRRSYPVHRFALAALLPLLMAAAGCDREANGTPGATGERGGPRAADPVAVSLAPVRIAPVDRRVEVVGTLFGDEQATISAKVPGRVRAILADVGDRVAPGAPLARIDPTDYALVVEQRELALREALARLGLSEMPAAGFDPAGVATVERARHQAANANARLERARQLHSQRPPLMSEQEFQDLQTAFQVAQQDHGVALLEARAQLAQARTRQSELAAARQRLDDTTIRAPGSAADGDRGGGPAADGATTQPRFAIAERLVSEGEYLREGDAMFRLVADDPIKLRAAVPERHVAQVRPGQTVSLRVEGYDRSFAGKIGRVNPSIDPQSRTFQIEALVPNPERLLRPSAFARATVTVGQQAAVMFVPEEAVVSFAGLDRVFTVADGKAVEHVVRLGERRAGYVALREPIEDAPAVVTGGATKLAKDVPVTVEAATRAGGGEG